jgi:hypothetical protein
VGVEVKYRKDAERRGRNIIYDASLAVLPLWNEGSHDQGKIQRKASQIFDFIVLTGRGQFNANKNDTASGN